MPDAPNLAVPIFPVAGLSADQARITTRFGDKQTRAQGFTGQLSDVNYGVDIAVPEGTPLVSPFAGRVVEVVVAGKNDRGYGNSIVIQDASGQKVRLSHMQQPPRLRTGDAVQGGQGVGAVGKTGNATGPHLDLEYQDAKGQRQDAMLLFGGSGAAQRNVSYAPGGAPMADTGQPPPPPKESPLVKTLRAQVEEATRDEGRAERTLNGALLALDRAQRELNEPKPKDAQGKDQLGTVGSPEQLTAAQKAVDAAQDQFDKAKARRLTTEQKLAVEEGSGETAAGKPPKGQTRTAVRDGYAVTEVADGFGGWTIDPSVPPQKYTPEETKPGEEEQRRAAAEASRASATANVAQAGYYEAQTKKVAQEAIAQEVAAKKRTEFEAALKAAEGKDPAERIAAIQFLAEQAALLDDPKTYLTYIQNQATQQFNQWQQLEQSTGQRYDPLTLQPVMDAAGQPVYTAAERSRREAQEAQKRQEEAQQRQEFQRGAQAVAGLESQRAEAFNQAMGQFEQSGVATGGRVAGLQAMRQPLGNEQIAAMLGLEPEDPKLQKYLAIRQQLQGQGQGQQPAARPPGPAGTLPAEPQAPTGQTRPIGLAPLQSAAPAAPTVPPPAPAPAPISAAASLVAPPSPGQLPAPSVTAPTQPGQTVAPPGVSAPATEAPGLNAPGLSPLQRLLAQTGALRLPSMRRQPVAV